MALEHDVPALVDRCMSMALEGLAREYPCQIVHLLESGADALTPRQLTPIFHGCFDWHSAVHSHWLLVRCCRSFPRSPLVPRARAHLAGRLTDAGVDGERRYLERPARRSFERPYGLAWLLQLCAELHEWDDADSQTWRRRLEPLEAMAVQRFSEWLPRLTHPVRSGEHSQTAFALGLLLDWARARGHGEMERLASRRARDFYLPDAGWNLAFEPGGHDFLSPALAEADLLRRLLDPRSFAAWLGRFLPELDGRPGPDHLGPVTAPDRSDGKLAHLDGLNLSRAWMLEGIVHGLPAGDDRGPRLTQAARLHRSAGLAALHTDSYMSTHWLGSFAIYLLTGRGM